MKTNWKPEQLQIALDYAILKRELEHLRAMSGLSGFLVFGQGLAGRDGKPELSYLALGLLLLAQAFAPSVFMSPVYLLTLPVLYVIAGLSLAFVPVVRMLAGGSPTASMYIGGALAVVGVAAAGRYRQFAHLTLSPLPQGDLREAYALVRNLRPASPKKEPDVLRMLLQPCPDQPGDGSARTPPAAKACPGRWKARLLPNLAVLLKEDAKGAFALDKSSFSAVTASTLKQTDYVTSLSIAGRAYVATMSSDSAQRLEQWLRCAEETL